MNKKILIATIFTTLILTVPMTSVIGVSDTTEDCNYQPVSNLHLNSIERLSNRLEKLLNKLEVYTKFIPILSNKNNPVEAEKLEDLSIEIENLKEMNEELKIVSPFKDYPVICEILLIIIATTITIAGIFWDTAESFPENSLFYHIFNIFAGTVNTVGVIIYLISDDLCDWYPRLCS